ncbi:MAG: hypothetical protein IKV43_04715 [Clostridia bacterium]|nr:hypothetical protein [Clostridia bacterium]
MKTSTKILSVILLLSLLLAIFAIGVAAYSESEEIYPDKETYPEEDIYDEAMGEAYFKVDEDMAKTLLIVIAVVFAMLPPLVPLTIFITKLIARRKEFEVVDLIILAVSLIWLLSGILIFIIIL